MPQVLSYQQLQKRLHKCYAQFAPFAPSAPAAVVARVHDQASKQ
jgi:hypothetical protein